MPEQEIEKPKRGKVYVAKKLVKTKVWLDQDGNEVPDPTQP